MGTCTHTVITLINMRLFILLLLLIVSVALAAKKPKSKGKGKGKAGLCITEEQMMRICHAGSAVGEKAMTAMETCNGDTTATGRALDALDMRQKKPSKGKGKGKGKGKCPTAEKIMNDVAEEYAEEICVFTEMGWLDNDMNSDDDLIMEDIKSLPNEISEALTGDDYDKCVAKAEKKIMKQGKKCNNAYTDEEGAQLMEVVNGIAHVECFKAMFDMSCAEYVSNTIASMAAPPMTMAGKK